MSQKDFALQATLSALIDISSALRAETACTHAISILGTRVTSLLFSWEQRDRLFLYLYFAEAHVQTKQKTKMKFQH